MLILLLIPAVFFILLAVFGHTIKQSEGAPFFKRYVYAPFMILLLSASILVVEFFGDIKKKFKK